MSQTHELASETPATPTVPAYVGEIRLLPFRHNKLPLGWYFCNGERFEFASPQGQVLTALDEDFRADWNMETDVCSISLPNLFSEDGRGCFLRPVDGTARQVGAWEGDAIRDITGDFWAFASKGTGAFEDGPQSAYAYASNAESHSTHTIYFKASKVVPTAPENRPLNLGMTPAIYLGV